MKNLLTELYGEYLTKYKKIKPSFPNYLIDNRELYEVSIFDCEFILVFVNDEIDLVQIKKQYPIYKQMLNKEIAFAFNVVLTRQRKSLIREMIPFISKNEQIFLPFIGSYFNKCVSNIDKNELVSFKPITQLLYLYILYNEKETKFNKKELADILHTSQMSITRASRELKKAGLIKEIKVGTTSYLWSELDKSVSYQKAKKYLINPKIASTAVSTKDVSEERIACGEYALSLRSDLAQTNIDEFAFYKDDVKNVDFDNLYLFDSSVDLIRVEKWKYNPSILSNRGIVDPVSLIISLNNVDDDRVKKSLKKIESEIDEWKIGT